jgi:hypothetical protein
MTGSPHADLLDPGFIADLQDLDIAEVRARRSRCNDAELELSYVRRMVQGRLDIVLDEQTQRSTGHGGADVASLVERLPAILSGNVHAPGFGRLPANMAPADVGLEATATLEAIAPADRMAEVSHLDDAGLEALVDALNAYERELSDQRRALHVVLDKLQGEVIRRYQSGEATVDSLLE